MVCFQNVKERNLEKQDYVLVKVDLIPAQRKARVDWLGEGGSKTRINRQDFTAVLPNTNWPRNVGKSSSSICTFF